MQPVRQGPLLQRPRMRVLAVGSLWVPVKGRSACWQTAYGCLAVMHALRKQRRVSLCAHHRLPAVRCMPAAALRLIQPPVNPALAKLATKSWVTTSRYIGVCSVATSQFVLETTIPEDTGWLHLNQIAASEKHDWFCDDSAWT